MDLFQGIEPVRSAPREPEPPELNLDPEVEAMSDNHPVKEHHIQEAEASVAGMKIEDRLEVVQVWTVRIKRADGGTGPVGQMFNYGPGDRGLSFPAMPPMGMFFNQEEANKAASDLRSYFADIKKKKKRPGSAQYWK